MITRRERQQTVQRTGIQQIPVQAPGQHPGDGALAGTARSVDGDDRSNIDHDWASWATRIPTWVHSARKFGKEVATLAQSWMRIGALARKDATLNAMAIR
ncbi:hypothetical protein D3C80_1975210 [compost metagenome]